MKVIDVTTGMSSDGAGAHLTLGAMALVNETFLQLVRTETHRRLEGRVLGGFWTGGRVYGYATVTEENPPDLEHPRTRPVIDSNEKEIVLRSGRRASRTRASAARALLARRIDLRNGLSVSERKAQNAIVGALKEALDRPEALARFESAFRDRAHELEAEGRASTPDLDRSVRDAEKRVANLTESLARVGWSDALGAKLADEERRLEALKAERSTTARHASPPSALPDALPCAATSATSSHSSTPTPLAVVRLSPATSAPSS